MSKLDITGSISPRTNSQNKKVYDVSYRWLDIATGKTKQSMKRGFKRKGDAQAFLDQLTNNDKVVAGLNRTMKEVADEWYDTEINGVLKATTCNWYRVNKENHIIPYIGMMKMQEITADTLQALYDMKRKSGLSGTSVHHIHRTLQRIYKYAVRKHYVTEDITKSPELVCKRVKKKKMQILNLEELKILIESCDAKGSDLTVAIALGGFLGLRRGEVLGLKWSAIDNENKMLEVLEQRTNYDEDEKTSELKTECSHRVLPIPDVLWNLLNKQKEKLAYLAQLYGKPVDLENGFVCCYFSEQYFAKAFTLTYFNKKFSNALKTAGIKHVRFHDLRHSYASWLIHKKMPLTTVSKLLGHSSPEITLRIYAHIINTAYLQECTEINKYLNETMGETV